MLVLELGYAFGLHSLWTGGSLSQPKPDSEALVYMEKCL